MATFAHDLQVVDVAIRLETMAGARVQSERELRKASGEAAVMVRSGQSRLSRQFPDLAMELDGRRWAIEVELTRKSQSRVEAKLRAYARTKIYDQVCYFVADDRMAAWIRERVHAASVDPSGVIVRLLPTAPIPASVTPEAEIAAFVESDDDARLKILHTWTARYSRKAG